jgi:hypothetical protein
MKMEQHMLVTAPVAAGTWYFTHSWIYVLMTVALGVLIDFDHVFDYIREEKKFNMKGLFIKSYLGDFEYFYVIFHAWEYIPLAWIIGALINNYTFSTVFSVAYISHMLPDQLVNNVKPFGYFFTYRVMKKFEMRELFYKGRVVRRKEEGGRKVRPRTQNSKLK